METRLGQPSCQDTRKLFWRYGQAMELPFGIIEAMKNILGM
jgi:hypothetical protein